MSEIMSAIGPSFVELFVSYETMFCQGQSRCRWPYWYAQAKGEKCAQKPVPCRWKDINLRTVERQNRKHSEHYCEWGIPSHIGSEWLRCARYFQFSLSALRTRSLPVLLFVLGHAECKTARVFGILLALGVVHRRTVTHAAPIKQDKCGATVLIAALFGFGCICSSVTRRRRPAVKNKIRDDTQYCSIGTHVKFMCMIQFYHLLVAFNALSKLHYGLPLGGTVFVI